MKASLEGDARRGRMDPMSVRRHAWPDEAAAPSRSRRQRASESRLTSAGDTQLGRIAPWDGLLRVLQN